MKHTVLTFLTVLIAFISFGQKENYQPGYIVKNYFDTTRGFINHQPWPLNPTQVSFRTSDGTVNQYTSTDITSFEVSGKRYESVNVEVELSTNEPKQLTSDPEFKIERRTAFIEAIIAGEKGLYALKFGGKPNFYIKYNGKLELLRYKQYLDTKATEKTVVQNNQYISQLGMYLAECTLIEVKLNGVTYTRNSLHKLIADYFYCTGKEITADKVPTGKIRPRLTAIAGVSATNLKFTSAVNHYLADADYETNINFTAGLGFEIFPSSESVSFVTELGYVYYAISGEYEDYPGPLQYVKANSTFKNHYLKLNVMPRFNIPIRKATLFFNGGVSFGVAIKTEGSLTEYRRLADDEQTNELEPYEKAKPYEIGGLIGTGVAWNRYSIQFRYESANGFTYTPKLGSNVTSFRLLFSYQFSKYDVEE